jgi:Uma2 family endonuclease
MSELNRDSDNPSSNSPSKVGQRRQFYFNDNGQPAYQVDDLTAEDYLNPHPGDEFFHGDVHDRSVRNVAGMLQHHYRYSPTTSVHLRPKMVWPGAVLDQPMPDVVIVNNLVEPLRPRPTIDLAAEQNAPGVEGQVSVRAIFEVTSPHLAAYDLENKRSLYERAGVPEYWIIDTGVRPQNEQVHFALTGYQLQYGKYQIIAPQAEGRWESKACRIWLGDLRTGKPLPLPSADEDPAISAQAEASRRAQSIAGQLKL